MTEVNESTIIVWGVRLDLEMAQLVLEWAAVDDAPLVIAGQAVDEWVLNEALRENEFFGRDLVVASRSKTGQG